MELPMTTRVFLLNVSRTNMRKSLGDVGESDGMIESLGGIEKLLEVVGFEVLLIKARPIRSKPGVQLLKAEEVLSRKRDRVPYLHSLNLIRTIANITMQDAEPQFKTVNRIFMELNKVAASLLEGSAKHRLEGSGVVHQDMTGNLHQSGLQDMRGAAIIGSGEVVLDHLDHQIACRVDLIVSGVLFRVKGEFQAVPARGLTMGSDMMPSR